MRIYKPAGIHGLPVIDIHLYGLYYHDDEGRLVSVEGDGDRVIVMNAQANDPFDPVKKIMAWSHEVTERNKRFLAHMNDANLIQRLIGEHNDEPFNEKIPDFPDDVIRIQTRDTFSAQLTDVDIDILRRAYHTGIIKNGNFQNKFLRMLYSRKGKNIESIFDAIDNLSENANLVEAQMRKPLPTSYVEDAEKIHWDTEFNDLQSNHSE